MAKDFVCCKSNPSFFSLGVRCLLAMNLLTRKMEEQQRLLEEQEALAAFSFEEQPLYDTRLPEPSDTTSSLSSMSSQSPIGSSGIPYYNSFNAILVKV